MTDVTAKLGELRAPFPGAVVGKLPKTTCKACSDAAKQGSGACQRQDHNMARCQGCGNWITSAHIHIDYVGHAEVTDRLLSVDPAWTWEPVAWGPDGLPLIVNDRLWIRLTVLGVTRYGVGSVERGKPDAEKQLIGDALRNAAMRFGVALDLWSKAELESQITGDQPDADAPPPPPPRQSTRRPQRGPDAPQAGEPGADGPMGPGTHAAAGVKRELVSRLHAAGLPADAATNEAAAIWQAAGFREVLTQEDLEEARARVGARLVELERAS